MADITCRKCGSTDYFTKPNGPHTEARCKACGAHIKFLAKPFDPATFNCMAFPCPLPKHRGKPMGQVAAEDPEYVRWMAENCKAEKLRLIAEEVIGEAMI